MKSLLVVMLTLVAFVVVAQELSTSVPDWYNNPPKSYRKYYGAGVGTSKAIDIAESKALLDAKTKIAEQAGKVKLSEKKTAKKSNTPGKQEETYITKEIEAQLTDVRVVKRAVVQDGENYSVYVLCEMKVRK